MSVTLSSRTKSVTGTSHSGDTETTAQLTPPDRWTNNITYRQLVVSSCIGIVQLWWHPYIHDMTRLVPFIFLYNVFSILVGYPQFYLELALGVITKKGVINCWDLSPMTRGVSFAMLLTCAFTALALSIVAAWCLALFVHSFHVFLPWLHCAATAQPPCSARHRPMAAGSETPAQSFFFNFVLHLKRDGLETGTGTFIKEVSIYFAISWTLIYCIVIKRIYSYSKLVLFKDVLAYFILMCCLLGATLLDGASKMFRAADWSVLFGEFQIWRDAIEFSLIQMTVSQGSLVMLGAYSPKQQHALARTAMLAFSASKTSSMAAALTLGASHGALMADYENATNIIQGSSASMVLWADYAARLPGSQFWSALIFFTLYVLAVTSTALLVQTIMSTLTGKSIVKIRYTFLIGLCGLFCFIGTLTLCTQGGLYILNFLMKWPVLNPRTVIAIVISMVITFSYGQTTFCEDVYFAVGEYPCVYLRVCWAVMPVFLMAMYLSGMASWPGSEGVAGPISSILITTPIFVFMMLYMVFKCRVRNIVSTEK